MRTILKGRNTSYNVRNFKNVRQKEKELYILVKKLLVIDLRNYGLSCKNSWGNLIP